MKITQKILAFFLSFLMMAEFPVIAMSENKSGQSDSEESIPTGEFYTVHVLGEVQKPGTYRISPSERVSDAIKRAGGINANGSKRRVQLRRQGTSQALDFFAYETYGWLTQNPYLLENDVVFVSLKKGEIDIQGPVKRPGVYEFTGKMSLFQVITTAGGFAAGLSPNEPIKVIRFANNGEKEIISITNEEKELKKFKVEKGDYIVVPHLFLVQKSFDYNLTEIPGDNIAYPTIKAKVYVVGEVNKPGAYSFVPAYGYKDYISNAGPLEKANFRKIQIVQKDGKKILARKIEEINAGDTIYVPAKAVSFDRVLGVTGALIGTTLSSILLYETLKD